MREGSMRWLVASLALLMANPSYATPVGSDVWDFAGDMGFVPLSITDAVTGAAGVKNINSSQNFGIQEVAVPALLGELPPGVINFTPNLVFRVSAFGTALPPPNPEEFGTYRNGFVSATFSGTYKLFNNLNLIDAQNFNISTAQLGSGSCVVECSFDAYQLNAYGPGVTVPTDEASSLNLVMQFSNLAGTLGFDDQSGQTTFVQFTSIYDIRMFPSFFVGPGPDPVTQVPLPPALLLFMSALTALGATRWFMGGGAGD